MLFKLQVDGFEAIARGEWIKINKMVKNCEVAVIQEKD